jgi:hypothetical protein
MSIAPRRHGKNKSKLQVSSFGEQMPALVLIENAQQSS